MTRRLTAALQAHRHLRGSRVLLLDDGQPINRKFIQCARMKAQRRASMVPDGRIHILRHSLRSRLAMLDVPATSIQDLAGRQNLQTTRRKANDGRAGESKPL